MGSQFMFAGWRSFRTLSAVAMLILSHQALSFQLVPTVSVIELPQNTSGVSLNLENPRSVPLPVELEIMERLVHEDGSEEYEPADDAFLVFPPQAVIEPGQTQSIRVQWLGSSPDTSRSYTLFAKEIPVDLSEQDKPMLQTVLRMGASVHVAPSGTVPKVTLVRSEDTSDGVRLTLENTGARFIYLNDVRIRFGNAEYTGNELANIAGRTLIPPSAKRTILIPNEKGSPDITIEQ